MRYMQLSAALLLCCLFGAPHHVQAQMIIEGKLLGADGYPMQKAHLVLEGPAQLWVRKVVENDGGFSLRLEKKGGYYLYLMGVHHEPLQMPIIVDTVRSVQLEVRLKTATYASAFDNVRVLGGFNDFSEREGVVLMQRSPDGTFTATLEASADTLAYQLLGVSQTAWGKTYPLSGTQADRYISNMERAPWADGNHFFSVVDVAGESTELTFDPRALPHSDQNEMVRFSDPTLDEIVAIYRDVEARELRSGLARGKYDWSQDQQIYHQRIKSESNPLLRQLALLRYFDELHPTEADSLLARQALREVPPTSPYWSLEARSSVGASNVIALIARYAKDARLIQDYIDRVIEKHFDPDVQAQFLYVAFHLADQRGDEDATKRYYTHLATEFTQTRQYENVRRVYDPERAIQAGKPMPTFTFVALDDSSTIHSSATLEGRTYLVDFWGTWCGPCIAEMPQLHEVYQEYQDEGFEILSVAFLDERADIMRFCQEQYPMPWLHTLVASEEDAAVRSKFEITGFPRPILVNESGEIIAVDEEIRGEKLTKVLRQVFNAEE